MDQKLSEIKSRIDELAIILGAPERLLPTYEHSSQTGRYHIEVDANGYHCVAVERGEELERYTSYDIDDILYYVFQNVSFKLASDYELSNRIQGQDFRRVMFNHEEELLSQLSQAWGVRRKQEHDEILKKYPFRDR